MTVSAGGPAVIVTGIACEAALDFVVNTPELPLTPFADR